ncbi:MAG: hypothetical protein V1921_03665 [Candidatus Altiarchaeota archaeon]
MKALHSFVHQSREGKITSLSMYLADSGQALNMSVSEKINDTSEIIRVKFNLNEIAAMSKLNTWSTYHSFEKEGKTSETRINWNTPFFSVEKEGKKIAIKFTDAEIYGFQMTLETAFQELIRRGK